MLARKFTKTVVPGVKSKICGLQKTILWLQLSFSTTFDKQPYAWKPTTVCKAERGCTVT